MIVQRTIAHNDNRTIRAGGELVHIRAVTQITRHLYPHLFPEHGFDPVGQHILGEPCRLQGIEYESFPLLGDEYDALPERVEIGVPKALTDHVREVFDGKVLWRTGMTPTGGRIYAILNNNVVAVINDGVLENW